MESITNFLDPKSIPDVTGDDLDVEKALDKKEAADDSDTVEVNITNNIEKEAPKTTTKAEKPKLSDVVLPGTKETDSEESKSSEEQETSTETETSTEQEETDELEPKETQASEPAQDTSNSETTQEAVEEPEAQTLSEPADDLENETDAESETAENESEPNDVENQEPEPTDEPVSDEGSNPQVDHGESDLDVDTQLPPPLLKLIGEQDFHNVKTYETPNGAKVVYLHNDGELCLCAFDFKVGSFYEDDSNRGISHLLEHLMFNGCPGMSSLEFNEKLDRLGMHVNAFTDRCNTVFHFSGLKVNFIPAFDLYGNLLQSFTATQDALDKERGVVINEIGVYNDNNWSVLHEAVNSQAYRQHPIAYPILGFEDVIRNISVDQVNSWYETNYNAKNLTIYLIGDFPEEDLVFVADKAQLFKDGNINPDPVITDAMTMPSYKNVITHKEGAAQTLIDSSLTFKNEAFNVYELLILSEVLGGTMSSYLWDQFREERSIAYQVGAYSSNMDADHFNIHLYAGLNDSSDADLAKSLFKDAFAYAKAIPEDIFNKGLNIAVTGLLTDEETINGLLDLIRYVTYIDVPVDTYIATLKNLTFDSYQTFAQQIDPDAMVTGILFPMEQ